jgi:hypothetical protein
MRRIARKGLMTVAAAGGVFAVTGGAAYAGSGAQGAAQGSPGVLSGNTVQIPVHVPVNVCGNTVDVLGLLNPAIGNECVNNGGGTGKSGTDSGGASAQGTAEDSPGVLSGNTVQAPVHVPVNVCGNTVDVASALNPSMGNDCANNPGNPQSPPVAAEEPADIVDEPQGGSDAVAPAVDDPRVVEPAAHRAAVREPGATLANTGAGGPGAGTLLPLGAGLLLGGFVLYRRGRVAQHR